MKKIKIRKKISGCLANFALLVCAILATLAAGEIFLKTYNPVRIHFLNSKHYRITSDEIKLYEPRPFSGPFNNDGILNNYDYSVEKPEDVYRVLILGDSIGFGLGMGGNNTYAKKLEEKLNGFNGGRKKVEIINLCVPGYKITQIVLRLKEKGLKYDPDLVVYHHWLDDAYISDPGWAELLESPFGRLIQKTHARAKADPDSYGYFLVDKILSTQIVWRCAQFGKYFIREKSLRENSEKNETGFPNLRVSRLFEKLSSGYDSGVYFDLPGFEEYFAGYVSRDNFRVWVHSLADISGICRDNNINCLMLLTPVLYDYGEGEYNWAGLHEYIKNIASEYSIDSMDITGEIGKYKGKQLRLWNYDPEHLNPFGHELIAEHLSQYLQKYLLIR